MQVSLVEMAGLIGVVLVISTGKVFDPLREFLKTFSSPYNPSKWLASLISCSMCSGVWVGAIWGVTHLWSWESIVVFSGLLSLLSFATNEVLGLFGILTLRVSRGMVGATQVQESSIVKLAQARARMRTRKGPKKVAPGNDISEEEANALLDQETELADNMSTSPDEAA